MAKNAPSASELLEGLVAIAFFDRGSARVETAHKMVRGYVHMTRLWLKGFMDLTAGRTCNYLG